MKHGRMGMKRALVCLFFVLALVMAHSTGFTATPHSDAWDTGDLLSWTPNVSPPSPQCTDNVSLQTTGGNPGGYLHIQYYCSLGGATTAKTELSGNYGFAQQVTISIDLKFLSYTGDLEAFLRFRYQDGTYNGWRYLLAQNPTINVWQTYTITINPFWTDSEALAAGWVKDFDNSTVVSFAQTVSNVFHPEIRLEGGSSVEAGIDNFILSSGQNMIDRTVWADLEFVREIVGETENKKLLSEVRAPNTGDAIGG